MAKKSIPIKKSKQTRVLVVDDDRALVDLATIQLEAAGYEVFKAYDGLEALKSTCRHHPDIILLDVMMPRMDGFQVCRFLKNYPPFDGIPIVFLTVKSGIGDRQRGLLRGGDDYVYKPLEMGEIQQKIDALVRSRPSPKERDLSTSTMAKAQEMTEMTAILKLGEFLDENLFKLNIIEEVSRAVADALEEEELIKTLLIGAVSDIGLGFDRAIYLVKSDDGQKLIGHLALGIFPEEGIDAGKWRRIIRPFKDKTLGEIYLEGVKSFPFLKEEASSFISDLILSVPNGQRAYDLTAIPGGEDVTQMTNLITASASRALDDKGVRAVPVVAKGQLIGALAVSNKFNNHPISDQDIKQLIILCNQVGLALERARLLREQHKWARELERLTNWNLSIIHSAGIGIVYIDPEGTIMTWNRAMFNLTGLETYRVVGRQLFEILSQLQGTLVDRRLSKLFEEEIEQRVGHFQIKFGRKSGYYDIKMSPVITRGIMQGAVLLIEDITRRVELQNEHWETFQYLSGIINYSADAIITTDRRGRIKTWNRGAEDIFGYDEAFTKGKSISLLFPKGQLLLKKMVLKKVGGGDVVQDLETIMVEKEGNRLYVSLTATPLKKADGSIGAVSIFIRDITERKKLIAQLVQTEKLASLGVMAAGMAHEINNPLTSIVMHTELLSMKGKLIGEERSYLDKISEEVDRISEIVRDLLVYSHARDKKVEKVSIDDVLKQAMVFIKRKTTTEDVEIEYASKGDLPLIEGHPNELLEMFLNILLNALDSLDDGGMITISTSLEVAGPEEKKIGKWLKVAIKDTGHGIAAMDIPKIFDPFYTTKAPGKGTGLGLMVVSQLVDKYQGRVEVASRPGKGTIFTVLLPAAKRAEKGSR